MYDPFGHPKNSLKLGNINIFDYFNKIIKPIQGYSLLNYLSWDSYILSHYSKLQKQVSYLGAIYIKYDRVNNIFVPFHITPEYIVSIIQLNKKSNPKLTKVIFGIELELGKYNHTNSIVINFKTKTINIFEPWGKNGRFRTVRSYYNKVKIDALKQLFKYFKNYKIQDIAFKYNIIGPQDSAPCNKISKIDNLAHGTLIVNDKYKDKNLFFQYTDNKYVYVTMYPEQAPVLFKIKKTNTMYYPCGFDIHNGVCDMYCLYFSLLVMNNPKLNEQFIHAYISDQSVNNIQLKITNIIQWVIQWYHHQIQQILSSNNKLAIKNNYNDINKLIKTINNKTINNYNRLSNVDKKQSDILSDKYCKNINLPKIYNWIQDHLAKKYNVKNTFIDYIVKQDNRIQNKCLLFLSVKNQYDITLTF